MEFGLFEPSPPGEPDAPIRGTVIGLICERLKKLSLEELSRVWQQMPGTTPTIDLDAPDPYFDIQVPKSEVGRLDQLLSKRTVPGNLYSTWDDDGDE